MNRSCYRRRCDASSDIDSQAIAALRQHVVSIEDAVRWACLLEATAPKAGYVYPGRSFADLRFSDFVIAADCVAKSLTEASQPFAVRMRRAVESTRQQTGTNVNLGIVLLLGPLVACDESRIEHVPTATWPVSMRQVLHGFTAADGREIFTAIASAQAGGLDEVQTMDVNHYAGPVDVLAAMRLAMQRDAIALQYATEFADLFDNIVPVVAAAIDQCGDCLTGISLAHLRLLAARPDSLIQRKCGTSMANEVMRRAATAVAGGEFERADFDSFLRADGHRRNPETTADLIAAALFVLLR